MNSPATPKLALCIPTYNRGAYIEQAIRGIAVQMPASGVEIVVVDNHSTDDTESIVHRLQGEVAALRYFKREVNVGADRNVIEAGDYSDSEYFWIFGSDDTMPPGALDLVLHAIGDGRCNLILGDANDCDLDLRQTGVLKFLKGEARDFDFSQLADVQAFLDATTMTASLFGFISSMVYKRAAWDRIPMSLYTLGTAYPQVFRSLDLVFRAGGPWRYLARPIANNRRNNCSYTAEFGEMQRYLIDFRMFRMAIDAYFSPNLQIRNRFKQFVRSCFGRMAQERIRTGIAVMDRLLEFFEADDAAVPDIQSWVRYPLVERAYRRFQANGIHAQVFAGKSSLHLGFRHDGDAIVKPIDQGAIGVDPGYSGYDGTHLPFESASKDAIYLSNWFPGKADVAKAGAEWLRVLRPEGHVVVTNILGGDGVARTIGSLLHALDAALPGCQVLHCRHEEGGGEADIVLRAPAASAEQLLAKAEHAHHGGQPGLAEALAIKVLEREPRNARALQLLGLLAYQGGRHGDAILRFTAALAIEPRQAEACLNLGCAYAALGGNAEAMQCFAIALSLRPGFAAAEQNLAFLQSSAMQHAMQREGFERLLAANPLLDSARQALAGRFGL